MTSRGYDPIALAAATEKVVVDGARRKYVQLGRPLRFYGGTTSATEVGCNLRCKFCFSDKPVWKPKKTGKFYTPEEVFEGLARSARKYGHKIISASASEGTIGREHLLRLLDLVEDSEFVYVLETNGMTLGNDLDYVKALKRYTRLHVRVSIKGDSPEQYHELTGAEPGSYQLPYRALQNLIDEGVSCNACLMASFSDDEGIQRAQKRLFEIHPGILKSLEIEKITLFPKVAERLATASLEPLKARGFGARGATPRRERVST